MIDRDLPRLTISDARKVGLLDERDVEVCVEMSGTLFNIWRTRSSDIKAMCYHNDRLVKSLSS